MIKVPNFLNHISPETYISVAVFALFFALSSWITGPAYLSDEVGYLDKAATIAGSVVHVASSWYGGYSLLISPAFIVSNDVAVEWRMVLLLNALMWAGSARLLFYVLRETHSGRSKKAVVWAGVGAILYPSWLVMSGYAFSTSGFVLVLMAAVAVLTKSRFEHRGWLLAGVLLSGYLCWIHPLGFIFAGLVATLLIVRACLQRKWELIVFGLASLLFAAVYVAIIDPWFRNRMSGSFAADNHYANVIPALHAAFSLHFWVQSLELLIGVLLFAVVATFGLIWYGALPVLRRAWHGPRQIFVDPVLAVMMLVVSSVLCVIGVTALLGATTSQFRIDQWVYGRYVDMYLFPLIGFGLLSQWRARAGLMLAVFAASAGVFLSAVINSTNTTFVFDNKVNVEAFWPMHIASVMHLNYYWLWGLLGSAGVAAVAFAARQKRYLALLLIPVALVVASNMFYHRAVLGPPTQVSTLYTYIRTHYTPSDCIGFTDGDDPNERFSLYSYYLHGYTVERMTLDQWLAMDCHGVYLTYSPPSLADGNLELIGEETTTGLYVLSRTGNAGMQLVQFQ